MITMAILSVLGLIALAIVAAVLFALRGNRLSAVASAVEKEVAAKLRHAGDTDLAFADALDSGTSFEQAYAEFQEARAAIGTFPDRAAAPWNCDKDELAAWRTAELRRRGEEVNRWLLVPAVTCALLVGALTVSAVAIHYTFLPADAVEVPAATQKVQAEGEPGEAFPATDSTPWR